MATIRTSYAREQSQIAADYTKVISLIIEHSKKLRLQIQLRSPFSNKWLDVYNRCTNIKNQINDVPGLLKDEQFKSQNGQFKNDILDIILYMILTRLKELYNDVKNLDEEAVNIESLNKTIQNTIANVMKLRIEKLEQKTKSETNNSKWYSVNKYYQIEEDIHSIENIIPDVHKKMIQYDFQDLFLKLLDKRVNELECKMQTQDKGHYGWHITFSKYNNIIDDIKKYKDEIVASQLKNKLVILEQRIKLIKSNIDKKYNKNKIRYKYDIEEATHFIARYKHAIKYFKGSADNPKYKQLFYALIGFKKDLDKSSKIKKYKTTALIDNIDELINVLNINVKLNESLNTPKIEQTENNVMISNTSIIEWTTIMYEVEYFMRLVKEISRKSYVEEAKIKLADNSNDVSIDTTYLNLNYIIYSIEALVYVGQLVPTATYIDEVYRRIKYSIPVIWKQCSQFIEEYNKTQNNSESTEEVDGEIIRTNIIAVSAEINQPRVSVIANPVYNCEEEKYLKDLLSFDKMPEKQDTELLKRQFKHIELKIHTLRQTITSFLNNHLEDTENNKLVMLKDIKERAKEIYTRVEEFNGSNLDNKGFDISYDITSLKHASESILHEGDVDIKDKRKSVVDLLNELTDLYDAKCTNMLTNDKETVVESTQEKNVNLSCNNIEVEKSTNTTDNECVLKENTLTSKFITEKRVEHEHKNDNLDQKEFAFLKQIIEEKLDDSTGNECNITWTENITNGTEENCSNVIVEDNIVWTENKLANQLNKEQENVSIFTNDYLGQDEKADFHNKTVNEKYTKSTDEEGNIIWEHNTKVEEIIQRKVTTNVEHFYTTSNNSFSTTDFDD